MRCLDLQNFGQVFRGWGGEKRRGVSSSQRGSAHILAGPLSIILSSFSLPTIHHHTASWERETFFCFGFEGEGEKQKGEREEYLTCLPQLPAAAGVPLNLYTYPPTYLPTREPPASDKRSSPQNQVWRGGGVEKRRRIGEREREETSREGKRSGTRGGYHTARKKGECLETDWQTQPRRRSEINQQPPLHHWLIFFFHTDYCRFLNISKLLQTQSLCFGEVQATQTEFWTARNLESSLPRCVRMRFCPLLVFLCLLCAGRAQKFSALTVGRATRLPRTHITCVNIGFQIKAMHGHSMRKSLTRTDTFFFFPAELQKKKSVWETISQEFVMLYSIFCLIFF